jgi:anti-sigma regulatory factor (Ser/Thr protein kinase)
LSYLELEALPSAVPCARLHARQILRNWGLDHLVSDAELLVSEIAGNAVQASQSPDGLGLLALRLLADPERLIIEAWDQSPHDPQLREASEDAEHGRGLMVIEAVAHQWGYRRLSPTLKLVWCELLIDSSRLGVCFRAHSRQVASPHLNS